VDRYGPCAARVSGVQDVHSQSDEYRGHYPMSTAIQLAQNGGMVSQPLGEVTPGRDKESIYGQDCPQIRATDEKKRQVNRNVIGAVREDEKSNSHDPGVALLVAYGVAFRRMHEVLDSDENRQKSKKANPVMGQTQGKKYSNQRNRDDGSEAEVLTHNDFAFWNSVREKYRQQEKIVNAGSREGGHAGGDRCHHRINHESDLVDLTCTTHIVRTQFVEAFRQLIFPIGIGDLTLC